MRTFFWLLILVLGGFANLEDIYTTFYSVFWRLSDIEFKNCGTGKTARNCVKVNICARDPLVECFLYGHPPWIVRLKPFD